MDALKKPKRISNRKKEKKYVDLFAVSLTLCIILPAYNCIMGEYSYCSGLQSSGRG